MTVIGFQEKINQPLTKTKISVLQINLGKRCNLACNHCHVEAGPKRTEELTPEFCQDLITLIEEFPQIKTVDLTGGAPEMNYGFKPLVEAATRAGKQVIVRSNLTIFLESDFTELPQYFADNKLRVIASLPCYLEDNVDKQRGKGVYQGSIIALQKLNQLGYGKEPNLSIDLVYNPSVPRTKNFTLTPNQIQLEKDYKEYLFKKFGIVFNRLFTLTNLPIGRVKNYLVSQDLYIPYVKFLEAHYNQGTLEHLMCRDQLSVDYLGNIYDCDFNQMVGLGATNGEGKTLTLKSLLSAKSLDLIPQVKTADYCYGCTAGSGSSCGGALV